MTTTRTLKNRLARLEEALHPEADPFGFSWVGWPDDPIPPEYADAPIVRLRWPEELSSAVSGDSSPLGIPKPR